MKCHPAACDMSRRMVALGGIWWRFAARAIARTRGSSRRITERPSAAAHGLRSPEVIAMSANLGTMFHIEEQDHGQGRHRFR
jgi:hypothetical protein